MTHEGWRPVNQRNQTKQEKFEIGAELMKIPDYKQLD